MKLELEDVVWVYGWGCRAFFCVVAGVWMWVLARMLIETAIYALRENEKGWSEMKWVALGAALAGMGCACASASAGDEATSPTPRANGEAMQRMEWRDWPMPACGGSGR